MEKPKPNQISSDVRQWRKEYKFLPSWLRDFHDQKDLFKTIDERYTKNEYIKDVNFMAAQVYVIDHFLWFMAQHGYTLQKSRAKLNFNDIHETIDFCNERRLQSAAEEMNRYLAELKTNKA